MNRAVQMDPENLDALLALGVSHTNELEQVGIITYVYMCVYVCVCVTDLFVFMYIQ